MDTLGQIILTIGLFFGLPSILIYCIDLISKKINLEKEKRLLIEKEENNKLAQYNQLIEEAERAKAQAEELKNYHKGKVREIEGYIQEKCDSYPHMAAIMADLLVVHYNTAARYLEIKKHPAYTEAKRIRELKAETKQILQQKKELEYQIEYIRKLFPNIDDIFDKGFSEEAEFSRETEETTDRVRLFVSPEEYQKLSATQKNQLALDRYLANRKSKWQIGRDYEMYVGYRYENEGFSVQYTGIIKKLEDMGRDLIATKGDKIYVIQCKNWSQEKTIHEKHIFQLFGSTVEYNINNDTHAVGVFVTTTELSPMAQKVAKELNIHVSRVAMGDFPRIKCNINRTTGERIYHLPFDQQYDRATIEKSRGECYVFTVKEAEEKGFRRAFKHFSY